MSLFNATETNLKPLNKTGLELANKQFNTEETSSITSKIMGWGSENLLSKTDPIFAPRSKILDQNLEIQLLYSIS